MKHILTFILLVLMTSFSFAETTTQPDPVVKSCPVDAETERAIQAWFENNHNEFDAVSILHWGRVKVYGETTAIALAYQSRDVDGVIKVFQRRFIVRDKKVAEAVPVGRSFF